MTEATQLALTEHTLAQVSPLSIVQQALDKGIPGEQLQALMDFAERYQANVAKQAYDAAIAQFKAKPPRINKNKDVSFGTTKYSHATLDEVTDKVTAALSAVGISHKWAVEQTDKEISVSCILTHAQGHSERTTLKASADTSGSKNPIQAIGSAVTYLQRYTLLAATGLAVAGSDNDGQGAGDESMNDQAYTAHMDNIQNSRTLDELKRVFKLAWTDAETQKDTAARDAFQKAYENRKKELSK
jgi:hypothetical protein